MANDRSHTLQSSANDTTQTRRGCAWGETFPPSPRRPSPWASTGRTPTTPSLGARSAPVSAAPGGCSCPAWPRQPLGRAAEGRTPHIQGTKAHGAIARRGAGVRSHLRSQGKLQVLQDPCYKEHSRYTGEASFGLDLLKTENTAVGPATRAVVVPEAGLGFGWEGAVSSPGSLQQHRPNFLSGRASPVPAAFHLEQSPPPHQPQPWLCIALTCESSTE